MFKDITKHIAEWTSLIRLLRRVPSIVRGRLLKRSLGRSLSSSLGRLLNTLVNRVPIILLNRLLNINALQQIQFHNIQFAGTCYDPWAEYHHHYHYNSCYYYHDHCHN